VTISDYGIHRARLVLRPTWKKKGALKKQQRREEKSQEPGRGSDKKVETGEKEVGDSGKGEQRRERELLMLVRPVCRRKKGGPAGRCAPKNE